MTTSQITESNRSQQMYGQGQDNFSHYTSIAKFLKKVSSMGGKLFLLRPNEDLKAIHFDPKKLNTKEGREFIDFLIEAEQFGAKILMSDPYRGLKKVSFTVKKDK